MAESEEKARDQVSGLVYLLHCLGFIINKEITTLEPTQSLEFLGFMVNTVMMELSLPAVKVKKNSGGVPKITGGGATISLGPLQIKWSLTWLNEVNGQSIT